MASANTGTNFGNQQVQNALYEFYLPEFRSNIKNPDAHYFMNTIDTAGYEEMVAGKYAVYGLDYGIQGGAGAIADAGNYKSPSSYFVAQQKVYMKNLQTAAQVDIKTMKAGVASGAFEDVVAKMFKTMLVSAKNDRALQMFTTETGILDIVNDTDTVNFTTAGGVAITINNPLRFQVGMRVDIYTTGGVIKADELIINDVDDVSKTLTLEATDYTDETVTSIALLATDVIITSGAKGNEITGLEAAIKDATGTYQGISRTSNKWYNAQRTASLSSELTEQALRVAKDNVEDRGTGNINFMMARSATVRGYEKALQTLKRFSELGTKKLAGGYKALTFDDEPFVKDRFTGAGEVYGLDTSVWFKPTYMEYDFDDLDGSIFKHTAGPRYDVRMIEFCNINTTTPRNNFYIGGVTEA